MDEETFARVNTAAVGDLAAQLTVEDQESQTQVILAVSPCRSGSTALLRAISSAGVAAACQPLKTLQRWRALGVDRHWTLKNKGHGVVFLKETLGPYSVQESWFDPLGLLMSHVPSSRLSLLIIGRHPHSCWRSLRELEGPFASVDLLAESYWATEAAYQLAVKAGIQVTALTYEAFRDSHPDVVLAAVGRRLGLPLGEGSSLLTSAKFDWPPDPAPFSPPGSYDAALASKTLSYHSEAATPCSVTPHEEEALERTELYLLYERWRQRSNAHLGLKTHQTAPRCRQPRPDHSQRVLVLNDPLADTDILQRARCGGEMSLMTLSQTAAVGGMDNVRIRVLQAEDSVRVAAIRAAALAGPDLFIRERCAECGRPYPGPVCTRRAAAAPAQGDRCWNPACGRPLRLVSFADDEGRWGAAHRVAMVMKQPSLIGFGAEAAGELVGYRLSCGLPHQSVDRKPFEIVDHDPTMARALRDVDPEITLISAGVGVVDAFRKRGIGRRLTFAVVAAAREAKYRQVLFRTSAAIVANTWRDALDAPIERVTGDDDRVLAAHWYLGRLDR